ERGIAYPQCSAHNLRIQPERSEGLRVVYSDLLIASVCIFHSNLMVILWRQGYHLPVRPEVCADIQADLCGCLLHSLIHRYHNHLVAFIHCHCADGRPQSCRNTTAKKGSKTVCA